jgi:hypothetical protein
VYLTIFGNWATSTLPPVTQGIITALSEEMVSFPRMATFEFAMRPSTPSHTASLGRAHLLPTYPTRWHIDNGRCRSPSIPPLHLRYDMTPHRTTEPPNHLSQIDSRKQHTVHCTTALHHVCGGQAPQHARLTTSLSTDHQAGSSPVYAGRCIDRFAGDRSAKSHHFSKMDGMCVL